MILTHLYGCGSCGHPVVEYPHLEKCTDCLKAPRISWGCDKGPEPGETMNFNIKTVAGIVFPTVGNYVFEEGSYDTDGIQLVTIAPNGDAQIKMLPVFNGRKLYKVTYRIRQTDGIQSKTGEINICMKNLCTKCDGKCNQLNAYCLHLIDKSVYMDCGTTQNISLADWKGFTLATLANVKYSIENINACLSVSIMNFGGIPTMVVEAKNCLSPGTYNIQVVSWESDLQDIANIKIVINDKCKNVICGVGSVCNNCTGVCDSNGTSDLSAGVVQNIIANDLIVR